MNNITIIDAIMGAGKSTYLIDMINRHPDKKYLIVVPLLSEIARFQKNIHGIHFIEPKAWEKSKSENLLELLRNGKNVITTHQLILRTNSEVRKILKEKDYTLIMDESLQVFQQFTVYTDDLALLVDNNIICFDEGEKVIWNANTITAEQYKNGAFSGLKEATTLGELYYPFGNNIRPSAFTTFILTFSPDFFKSFNKIYIATYLWNSNFQKHYFDFYDIRYNHMSLVNGSLLPYSPTYEEPIKEEIRELLHICKDEKLNEIGVKTSRSCPLSKGWFNNQSNEEDVDQLQHNIYNFFRHKINSKANRNMWVTYKDFRNKLKGKGYSGSKQNPCFVSLGTKCTNDFIHKNVLVFAANLYMEPHLKHFFIQNKLPIPEDEYALSEMIQWIWRSAIRERKPIDLYVPSERMRNLLEDWLAGTFEKK